MYAYLKQHILTRLIPADACILMAVSGGPDSVALAHVLWRFAQEKEGNSLSLLISHIHHGVRRESDQEELLVRQLAEEWQIPFLVHRFDAKSYALETGQSFQEAARQWRYARWQEDMLRENCTLLATAHHLGDQAETVLYRLLRGSGTAGLAGIYPLREGVVRPLLTVSKEDILVYCREEKLPFALDASNEEAVYVRNKIRLQLLPELEKNYNVRVQEALGRTAELLQWDEQCLAEAADRAWEKYGMRGDMNSVGIKLEAYQEPPALLSRVIRRAAAEISGEQRGLGFHYVKEIMNCGKRNGWEQHLPGLKVSVDLRGVWFWGLNPEDDGRTTVEEGLEKAEPVRLGQWFKSTTGKGDPLWVGLFPENTDVPRVVEEVAGLGCQWHKVVLGHEVIQGNLGDLSWRRRQPRDRLRVTGLGHKSLKKVFQEAEVASPERNRMLLLALGQEILWIPELLKGEKPSVLTDKGILGLRVLPASKVSFNKDVDSL